mgnify:FL=1
MAEALGGGIVPGVVLVPESRIDDERVAGVLDRLGRSVGADATEVLVVRDAAFGGLTATVNPQPMLALGDRPVAAVPEQLTDDAVVLVLVDVGDPGNVGTLVRLADAGAAAAVVVVGGADPWGPKAVRASAGSVLRVPIVAAENVADALGPLRAAGATVVATDVRHGEPHDGGVLTPPVAIVLGSEPRGLDRSIAPLVDHWTRIDMRGPTESLNVAMAGALLAYEASSSADSSG